VKHAIEQLKEGGVCSNNKPCPLKDQVMQLTGDVATLTATVSLLNTEIQALGGEKADSGLKTTLIQTVETLDEKRNSLAYLQSKLTAYINLITDIQTVRWPEENGSLTKTIQVTNDAIQKWTECSGDKTYNGCQSEVAILRANMTVHLALYQKRDGKWQGPAQTSESNLAARALHSIGQSIIHRRGCDSSSCRDGIPVRFPQTGRLVVCSPEQCPDPYEEVPLNKPGQEQIASDFPILQFGKVYYVPAGGGIFRAENGIVALDANGNPASIEVIEKVAGAVAASASLKDIATEIAALPGQKRANQLAETQGKTGQLNANVALTAAQASAAVSGQTSKLSAQTAIIAAQNNLATAQASADSATITNQTTLLNARAALASAQANSQVSDETNVLAAQTALLNAQAAQINAAQALAKAKQASSPSP